MVCEHNRTWEEGRVWTEVDYVSVRLVDTLNAHTELDAPSSVPDFFGPEPQRDEYRCCYCNRRPRGLESDI